MNVGSLFCCCSCWWVVLVVLFLGFFKFGDEGVLFFIFDLFLRGGEFVFFEVNNFIIGELLYIFIIL